MPPWVTVRLTPPFGVKVTSSFTPSFTGLPPLTGVSSLTPALFGFRSTLSLRFCVTLIVSVPTTAFLGPISTTLTVPGPGSASVNPSAPWGLGETLLIVKRLSGRT